jgi:hypothetical protein
MHIEGKEKRSKFRVSHRTQSSTKSGYGGGRGSISLDRLSNTAACILYAWINSARMDRLNWFWFMVGGVCRCTFQRGQLWNFTGLGLSWVFEKFSGLCVSISVVTDENEHSVVFVEVMMVEPTHSAGLK